MNTTQKGLLAAIVILSIALVASIIVNSLKEKDPETTLVKGVQNYLDTSASSITHTTSTVNTTSTQVFSSISKFGQIINDTTAKLTCSLDATGTTAASSTVASGRGIIIPPMTSSTVYSTASFGECYPGAQNCYAHKGAVNCLAASAVTITKWSK